MSFPRWELARALSSGSFERAEAWARMLTGVADGSLRIGSRTPIRGLPVWVTPRVLRGGFVSGEALAGGPLEDDELALARRLGLPPDREALFAWHLTGDGLAELTDLLTGGGYEVRIPEDSALLTVAALARAGRVEDALTLLDSLSPFTGALRFMPRRRAGSGELAGHVHRESAAQAAARLTGRTPNPRVEAQREALTVWLPLTDRFVAFWQAPGDDALARAGALVDDYDRAVANHPRCGKYRNPKQNLPILVAATRAFLTGDLQPGQLRRVQTVLAAVAAKRGAPGEARLTGLRAEQARVAALPAHTRLAEVAAGRLAGLPAESGIRDVDAVAGPVRPEEAEQFAVPVGTALPASVDRVVRRAMSGTPEELVAAGVVPSSEVLAELIPALTAVELGRAVPDPVDGALLSAGYEAFRRRRSLLLLNLEKQVQFEELPWVRPLVADGAAQQAAALPVARRVAALALDAFPGTALPNPLISELSTLFAAGGLELPLTEELAADIFMGRFSPKFMLAARVAAGRLRGSLYERYYGLDYAAVLATPDPQSRSRAGQEGELLRFLTRAATDSWSVAANGTVIEAQQVLTTHNLATLVFAGGVRPSRSWAELFVDAGARCAALLALAQRQRYPLATVKDAAYAWRQAVFFLTLTQGRQPALAALSQRPHTWPMTEVLAGLEQALADRTPERPFLGWTLTPHWAVRR